MGKRSPLLCLYACILHSEYFNQAHIYAHVTGSAHQWFTEKRLNLPYFINYFWYNQQVSEPVLNLPLTNELTQHCS